MGRVGAMGLWCLLGSLLLAACARLPPTVDETNPEPTGPTGVLPTTDTPPPPWADSDRAVVLVSLDGFRWDYVDRVETPALDRLIAEGVRADGLIPVFPSHTFPNHFTQVTGLYPTEHGIVGNGFWDEELQASFDMEQTGSQWWGGEPIWITAAKQGLRTTTMFWPGSETDFDGLRPDVWVPFNNFLSNQARVDQVLAWMDEPQPPHFTTLYFSDVDHAGHVYGPDSAEVEVAVVAVDAALQQLIDGLEARGRLDMVDLIVVSDHGMTALSRDRAVFLDEHVDINAFWIASWGPYVTLDPVNEDATGVLDALATLPNAHCTDAATRPPELHYPSGPRVPPILCTADLGYSITSHAWFDASPQNLTGGTHGYLPSETDMHGLFLARGPHLQVGLRTPALSSVHLYALFAELLQITPAPNSGDRAQTEPMTR